MLGRYTARYAVVFVLAVMVAVFSGLAPATFFTTSDFESILNTQTVLVVLALGLTVALAVGEFDMSITAVVDFTAVLVAHLTGVSHWSPGLVVVLSLGVALCIGVTNAIIVVVLGVNSFITTLAMGTLVVGLVVACFWASTTGNLPTAITQPVSTQVHGLDLSVFYAFGLVIILWYILENTPVGRQIFFTGEGREAARLGGIRVNRIRFGGLVTSAVGAWLAGILLLGQTGAANPTIGDAFLLPAFAAAFLGATTIRPGRFNALGTLTAVYLLAVGAVGLQLLGAADWVTDVFNGGALIIAVTFAQVASRGRPNWTRSRRLSIAEPVERAEAVT